jgi:aspartate carbamoyltransferase regulatory subunit
MKEKEGIIVEPIKGGTVIDHIQAGKALTIVKFLRVSKDANMGIAINVPSQKYGKKDIIFVENLELSEKEIAKVALISQTATLNIIRNGKVMIKRALTPPEVIEGIISCPNPNCISNHEDIESRFRLLKRGDFSAICYYCEIMLEKGELESRIV